MDSYHKKIIQAFENSKFTWRTVRGVARETGIKEQEVTDFIKQHGDEITRSASNSEQGEALFASRKILREKGSPLRRISAALRNRGG